MGICWNGLFTCSLATTSPASPVVVAEGESVPPIRPLKCLFRNRSWPTTRHLNSFPLERWIFRRCYSSSSTTPYYIHLTRRRLWCLCAIILINIIAILVLSSPSYYRDIKLDGDLERIDFFNTCDHVL